VYGTEVSRGGSVLREIARNIERIESGKGEERVCLAGHGEGGHSCVWRAASVPLRGGMVATASEVG
jgi:hypothetical protein